VGAAGGARRESRAPERFGSWRRAARALAVAARQSAFVRSQLRGSAVRLPALLRDPAAWRELRPVTKDDLLRDQQASPPFGRRRCVPLTEIDLVVESSGSTGKGRETHYLSRRGRRRVTRRWAAYLAAIGIGPRDVVALAFPIGMAGGGVKHADAYAELGAKVLRVANLTAERKLDAMAYYGATVLVATPSYVDRLAVVAAETGRKVRDLGVRRILVATQSVTVDWVRATEEQWGARLHEWYGTSAGLLAFSCAGGMVDARGERGTLHWDPDFALQEVVDPATGEWIDGDGRGELVGTPLESEAEALFRIRTGDEVRFRPAGSCRCGRDWPGIESGTVRRLDDMFKVKGVNLWPSYVETTVFGFPEVRDYKARIFQDEARREVVELAVLAGSPPGPAEGLVTRLGAALREATGVSFAVRVVEDAVEWNQTTAGEAGKARRWVDERPGG